MSGSISLRPFASDDVVELVDIYRDAIRCSGPGFYSPEQIAVWSRYPEDMAEFQTRLSAGTTMVAVDDGVPVAFGQLDPADHIALLYCRGSHVRRGLATQIYQALEARAVELGQVTLDTAASRVSRPLFEKLGMRVIEREEVVRHGIVFERFRMAKLLVEPAASRWVILGNSASGKTTLARKIAEINGAAVLDLDTIAWDPAAAQPTRRDQAANHNDIRSFIESHPAWVIEGCYEDLIEFATGWNPVMVFLRPDVETCLARARQRKFEAHKFATPEAQEAALGFLLEWIRDYPVRAGSLSQAAHLRTFDSYSGRKILVGND